MGYPERNSPVSFSVWIRNQCLWPSWSISSKASHSRLDSKYIIYCNLSVERWKFKVRSTQFGHCEFASWVHSWLHICNSRDSYAQERRCTLGCLGQGKHVLLFRSWKLQHDRKELNNPGLHITLPCLKRASLACVIAVFSLSWGWHCVLRTTHVTCRTFRAQNPIDQ